MWVYSLEVPHRGTSNEYPQYTFHREMKKKKFPDTLSIWRSENGKNYCTHQFTDCLCTHDLKEKLHCFEGDAVSCHQLTTFCRTEKMRQLNSTFT